jgi:ribosomal protein S14
MKKRILNDINKRNILKKNELKFIGNKIVLLSKKLESIENIKNCSSFKCNNSFSKIRNRCYLTSRSKSVNNLTKVSRIKFKELSFYGLFLGIKRYNW